MALDYFELDCSMNLSSTNCLAMETMQLCSDRFNHIFQGQVSDHYFVESLSLHLVENHLDRTKVSNC